MGMIDYVLRNTRLRLVRGEKVHWSESSKRGAYIRQVILSAPPWVDRSALRALKHPMVCGLTIPWNLRIVHWRANLSKGSAWHPDQMCFPFAHPEVSSLDLPTVACSSGSSARPKRTLGKATTGAGPGQGW